MEKFTALILQFLLVRIVIHASGNTKFQGHGNYKQDNLRLRHQTNCKWRHIKFVYPYRIENTYLCSDLDANSVESCICGGLDGSKGGKTKLNICITRLIPTTKDRFDTESSDDEKTKFEKFVNKTKTKFRTKEAFCSHLTNIKIWKRIMRSTTSKLSMNKLPDHTHDANHPRKDKSKSGNQSFNSKDDQFKGKPTCYSKETDKKDTPSFHTDKQEKKEYSLFKQEEDENKKHPCFCKEEDVGKEESITCLTEKEKEKEEFLACFTIDKDAKEIACLSKENDSDPLTKPSSSIKDNETKRDERHDNGSATVAIWNQFKQRDRKHAIKRVSTNFFTFIEEKTKTK